MQSLRQTVTIAAPAGAIIETLTDAHAMSRLVGPSRVDNPGTFVWGDSRGELQHAGRDGLRMTWRMDHADWPHGFAGITVTLEPVGAKTRVRLEISGVPGHLVEEVADWWAILWQALQSHLEHRLRPRRLDLVRRRLER